MATVLLPSMRNGEVGDFDVPYEVLEPLVGPSEPMLNNCFGGGVLTQEQAEYFVAWLNRLRGQRDLERLLSRIGAPDPFVALDDGSRFVPLSVFLRAWFPSVVRHHSGPEERRTLHGTMLTGRMFEEVGRPLVMSLSIDIGLLVAEAVERTAGQVAAARWTVSRVVLDDRGATPSYENWPVLGSSTSLSNPIIMACSVLLNSLDSLDFGPTAARVEQADRRLLQESYELAFSR